jgi:hypothetical protein
MGKQKAQGTRHESWLVDKLKESGHSAKRIAEGGSLDEGDIEAYFDGKRWVLEAKARQTLNVQDTLGDARRKANASSEDPVPVAVVWKRLVRVPGLKVRQPVNGERIIVCVSLDDFLALLNNNVQDDGTQQTQYIQEESK